MKIKELLYQTPEMTEDRLLELIKKHCHFLKKSTLKRIEELYGYGINIEDCILKEWDIINEKNSYLTKSQRDEICGLVSTCLVMMTSNNKSEEIPEIEENEQVVSET